MASASSTTSTNGVGADATHRDAGAPAQAVLEAGEDAGDGSLVALVRRDFDDRGGGSKVRGGAALGEGGGGERGGVG
jgi:hypothetical protein